MRRLNKAGDEVEDKAQEQFTADALAETRILEDQRLAARILLTGKDAKGRKSEAFFA
ncbi:MAG: hypothetical protein M3O41_14315 [Pseudomonadota bacterium]|nr:hypothetical protein [Pseudomonadota bacterium]